jgi:hypothetical protein
MTNKIFAVLLALALLAAVGTLLYRQEQQQKQHTQALNDIKTQQQELIANAKRFQSEQRDLAIRANQFTDGFAAMQQVKVQVAEYVASSGKWPANNTDVGAPAPESFRTESLNQVKIEPFEKTARIRAVVGAGNERIDLIARMNGAGNITWQCVSPDVKDIQTFFSTCVYRAD